MTTSSPAFIAVTVLAYLCIEIGMTREAYRHGTEMISVIRHASYRLTCALLMWKALLDGSTFLLVLADAGIAGSIVAQSWAIRRAKPGSDHQDHQTSKNSLVEQGSD